MYDVLCSFEYLVPTGFFLMNHVERMTYFNPSDENWMKSLLQQMVSNLRLSSMPCITTLIPLNGMNLTWDDWLVNFRTTKMNYFEAGSAFVSVKGCRPRIKNWGDLISSILGHLAEPEENGTTNIVSVYPVKQLEEDTPIPCLVSIRHRLANGLTIWGNSNASLVPELYEHNGVQRLVPRLVGVDDNTPPDTAESMVWSITPLEAINKLSGTKALFNLGISTRAGINAVGFLLMPVAAKPVALDFANVSRLLREMYAWSLSQDGLNSPPGVWSLYAVD